MFPHQGLKSFSCNVTVDWDAMFKQFNGSPLPADSPVMVYLNNSRLGVKEDVPSGAEVTWANTGTQPDSFADSASKMRGGIKQMLDGFFEAGRPTSTVICWGIMSPRWPQHPLAI